MLDHLPVTADRARGTGEAVVGSKMRLAEALGARHRPAGGGVEFQLLGQSPNQFGRRFFRRNIGFAGFQPLQLPIPRRQFGRWQWEDVVDFGDFGVGVGIPCQDAPDGFVAFGALEVLF